MPYLECDLFCDVIENRVRGVWKNFPRSAVCLDFGTNHNVQSIDCTKAEKEISLNKVAVVELNRYVGQFVAQVFSQEGKLCDKLCGKLCDMCYYSAFYIGCLDLR